MEAEGSLWFSMQSMGFGHVEAFRAFEHSRVLTPIPCQLLLQPQTHLLCTEGVVGSDGGNRSIPSCGLGTADHCPR